MKIKIGFSEFFVLLFFSFISYSMCNNSNIGFLSWYKQNNPLILLNITLDLRSRAIFARFMDYFAYTTQGHPIFLKYYVTWLHSIWSKTFANDGTGVL